MKHGNDDAERSKAPVITFLIIRPLIPFFSDPL